MYYNQASGLQFGFRLNPENVVCSNISPGTRMKILKICYFSTAALSVAFLLEAFLPIQIF
jgi:hypothetical protein